MVSWDLVHLSPKKNYYIHNKSMIILLGFAFLSGLVTIFAPCIWPLLPIILSSTATGGHRKPLGITLGILISFGLLTLTISYIIKIIPFDPNLLRYFAVIVIGLLGLVLIVPKLSEKLESFVSRGSGRLSPAKRESTGFLPGLITGLSLGIVWAPCAGPILATIATLSATRSVNSDVLLVTAVYLIGIGIPLFIFAWAGKYLFAKSRLFSKYTGAAQQIFGIIMIITALAIATNFDKTLEVKLLDIFPSYGQFLTKLESNSTVKQQLDRLKEKKSSEQTTNGLFNENKQAPEIIGITKWLNLPAGRQVLTLKELKGKVVLIDFWTYTCINCIRTLPHITSWYDKYKDKGFVVIGVHTPEFEFEKDTNNVASAIKQYKINYPVGQDNNYLTWNNYGNQYWPAEYLIDSNGIIRRVHFGEGEYDQMELAVQSLLKETGRKVNTILENMPDQAPRDIISPETYLGSKRMQYYYPSGNIGNTRQTFKLSEDLAPNSFSLGGEWEILDENARTITNSVLNYNFYANKVFLVMKPIKGNPSTKVKVFLDGKIVNNSNAGEDVKDGEVLVNEDRLYNLIDLKGNIVDHILRLEFENTGTEIFAFTFG